MVVVLLGILSLDQRPEDFTFTVTGNGPSPRQFAGSANCVDVTIGPGEYAVSEATDVEFFDTQITDSDCVQDPNNQQGATGEIQVGQTHESRFNNFISN